MLLACFAPIFLTILPFWSLSSFFFRYKQCIAKENLNGVLLVFIWFPESRIILNNKTRHLYIYVAYSLPNGWTDWAEVFCEHLWVVKFFFHGQRRALQLVYVIKQDIRIYVPYIWPNGWNKWDEFFWGNHGYPGWRHFDVER